MEIGVWLNPEPTATQSSLVLAWVPFLGQLWQYRQSQMWLGTKFLLAEGGCYPLLFLRTSYKQHFWSAGAKSHQALNTHKTISPGLSNQRLPRPKFTFKNRRQKNRLAPAGRYTSFLCSQLLKSHTKPIKKNIGKSRSPINLRSMLGTSTGILYLGINNQLKHDGYSFPLFSDYTLSLEQIGIRRQVWVHNSKHHCHVKIVFTHPFYSIHHVW